MSVAAKARLDGLTLRAADVLCELLEEPTADPIRLKAAMEVLDRNDTTSKLQRIQATSVVLSAEDARQLQAAMQDGALVAEKYGVKYLPTVT